MLWPCALKDLRRLRRDPAALLMWLGFPLFLIVIMSAFFGKESPKPHGLLLIADEDKTFLSGALANLYNQGKLAEMIKTEKVNQADGRKRMDKGEASALLVIPKGFADAFIDNTPLRLPLITNPSQRIMPGLIEESLSIVFDGIHYLQRIAGDEVRAVGRANRPSELQVVDISRRFTRIAESLRRYTDPLAIELQSQVVAEKQRPAKSFGALFFPSMLMLSFLFIAQGMAMDLWKERSQGALRRFVSSPARLESWLGGKLLAASLVFFAVSSAGMLAAHYLLDLSLDRFAPAVAWVCASGVGLLLFMMLLTVYAPSERGAGVIANLVTFPLMLCGGSFFPFEMMPANLAAIGRLTPNGWALTKLQQILDGQAALLPFTAASAGLAVFVAGSFAIVARRVRRRFAQ
jgi:ABC-type Na+ efflux pump permease subunit